jgi:hypothetical protein
VIPPYRKPPKMPEWQLGGLYLSYNAKLITLY